MSNYGNNNGYNGYNNYNGGNNGNGNYYNYNNDPYISDGHGYFGDDYVANEYDYNREHFVSNNDVYYENLSDSYNYNQYGDKYYEDNVGYMDTSIYNSSATGYIPNIPYGQAQNYYDNNLGNTCYIPTGDLEFDDTYILQNQYYDDDDEKLISARDIISLGICVLFAFLLAYLITTYVAQHTMVDGKSMSYNLSDGDVLIIDKLSYHFNDPERFDIVVFPIKSQKKTYYIKRIIGLPGEHVKIDDEGNVYINDKLLPEEYGCEIIQSKGINNDVTLQKDEYYVLGDNRNHSEDSRYTTVGNIKRTDIVGKAIFRLWKIENFGQIDNLVNARYRAKNGTSSVNKTAATAAPAAN